MITVDALLREAAGALAAAGVEQPRREARLLLEVATGTGRSELLAHPERPLAADEADRFRAWIGRRARREPMAYILGRAEFWSLSFAVAPGVLVPRSDTETLIEAVIRWCPDRARPLRILDIGVGSGCLLLTLLHHFPNASGVGTDVSPVAQACTRENARALGVSSRLELLLTPWAEEVRGGFDLLVSNPPYIRHDELAGLQPEVARYEPALALDGGPDGLDAYRAILPEHPRLLRRDGAAFLEIGAGQEEAVLRLASGWVGASRMHRDLAGIVRCLELRWTNAQAASSTA